MAKKDQLGQNEQPRAISSIIASNLAHAKDRLQSMKEKSAIKAREKEESTKTPLDVHAALPDATLPTASTSGTNVPVSHALADETTEFEVSILQATQSLDFEIGEESN